MRSIKQLQNILAQVSRLFNFDAKMQINPKVLKGKLSHRPKLHNGSNMNQTKGEQTLGELS